ncbi:MAG TPA: putative toxin-antitoxin system toxin component, PIN family [Spirochaetota bacterium]|nr:putative toxin-antitoxin system toxin component, PIN family [Spirochaetota bacterium]
MKVVIDTNVLVSSILNPNGNPAKIINLILEGSVTILYDNRLFEEYYQVLKRDKFGFTDDLINPLLDFIKNEGEYVNSTPLSISFTDEEDKKFYEVLISGKGEYLVTGNLTHFPNDKNILSPKDFLKELNVI